MLKKYQLVEVLDPLEELESESRIIIYPCINMVLLGEEVKHLIESFQEDVPNETEQAEVFSIEENEAAREMETTQEMETETLEEAEEEE